MKILFYTDSLHSGGKERRLTELIQGLSKFPDYEMQLVLSKKVIHYEQIYLTGIKIHFIERGKFKKNPKIFFKFYRIVKSFKPDLIHVWNYTEAIFTIPTKMLLNIPLVNSQIASAPKSISHSSLRHKLTFRFSDQILANSFAGLEAYREIMSGAVLRKCKVIYNGFNFERIDNLKSKRLIRERFGIKTKYIVGMAANFSYKKDYRTYIKAASLILKKGRDITFLCIGSGDSENFKQLVLPENKKHILFLGRQDAIESIMNICDIGVLATFTEGISNSLLEFMALGKSIVVTGEGGCKELVFDNKNGYLLHIENYRGMAKKIEYILDNDKKHKEFGKRSKEIVVENFSLAIMIDEFKKVYKDLLN